MKIKSITIENFRLLQHVELRVEEEITLIVGKNNTGKTSFINFLQMVLEDKSKGFTFDDYPVSLRNSLYDFISKMEIEKMEFEEIRKVFQEPSMQLKVDYSSVDENSSLGSLSPFVIDLDSENTIAIIDIRYGVNVSKETFINFVSTIRSDEEYKKSDDKEKKNIIRKHLTDFFTNLYKLRISAINPLDEEDFQDKTKEDLKRLLSVYFVKAERAMDESDDGNAKPLEKLLNRIFSPITDIAKDDESEGSQKKKDLRILRTNLQDAVAKFNIDVNAKIDAKMAQLIDKSIGFGYPNTDEVSLSAKANIKLLEQIKKNTDLWYVETETSEFLPSTFNGLGYKNLLKIEFELVNYLESVEDDSTGRLYLLFIEEPESHMHPQLQQRFISFLNEYLQALSKKEIQVFITTHSTHIANQVPFSNIRFAMRQAQEVAYKDLKLFSEEKPENAEFIQKYLTLYKCDLFFADKAILFEGSSERLLLPAMINKLGIAGKFKGAKISLDKQYVTLVEVGGAYAYMFFEFLNFLGVPSLIITDIDSVDKDGKKTFVNEGKATSNPTIKWWLNNYVNSKKEFEFEDVKCLSEEERTKDKMHLAFQVAEYTICPRSLEEAIMNANRVIYRISDTATEADIIYNKGSKTDFALSLLMNHPDFNVPRYIENGLLWLNEYNVFEVANNE